MRVVAIMPARMASTRFPGKPLARIHGRSMIEHVYYRTKCSNLINDVYVATCDIEIAKEVKKFKGNTIMTSHTHVRGNDRVAEAVKKLDTDLVINVQGDEPMVDPDSLDKAITLMMDKTEVKCLNLISKIKDWDTFISQDVVKTTFDKNNRVLYFSREPIPSCAMDDFNNAYKQIGIYLVQKELLLEYTKWDETPLEKKEKVDMLRFLENGISIYSFLVKDMISVDLPEERIIVENLLSKDKLYNKLFK